MHNVRELVVNGRPGRHRLPELVSQPRAPRRPPRSNSASRRALWTLAIILVGGLANRPIFAEGVSTEQMQGLDEQVQEIKSDVLSIATELNLLEEKLLYPSNTQVAVFLSIADGEKMRLDSAQIQIDGQAVAHYIYSFKELEALQKGGVQRIYTGNLTAGEHQLTVSVAGKLPEDKDFNTSASFAFRKAVEPALVGVSLAEQNGDVSVQLGGW